jgi:uncharacterized protein (TIGR02217 family)
MQDAMLYTGREVNSMSRSLGGGLRRAFDGVVFDGMRLSDALAHVARSMVDTAYNTAMRPVQNAHRQAIMPVESMLSWAAAVPAGRRDQPGPRDALCAWRRRARRRRVSDARGTGLMGEAGPEAILPLRAGRTAASASQRGGRRTGQRHDEHHDARCAGLPPQPEPDRRRDGPRAGARAAQPLRGTCHELSRGPVSGQSEPWLGRRARAAHRGVTLTNGYEERNTPWAHSRHRYDAGAGMRSLDDVADLMAFFEARSGMLHGFRWKDWADWKSCAPSGTPAFDDQRLGTGDGVTASFQLSKRYASGADAYDRPIVKPVSGTVLAGVGGVERVAGSDFDVDLATGILTFATPPGAGEAVTAGFEFDVPVRFDTDTIQVSVAAFHAGEVPSVPILELRL